jgi:hypothetical protein
VFLDTKKKFELQKLKKLWPRQGFAKIDLFFSLRIMLELIEIGQIRLKVGLPGY